MSICIGPESVTFPRVLMFAVSAYSFKIGTFFLPQHHPYTDTSSSQQRADKHLFEFLGLHSGTVEVSIPQGYSATSLGEWCPTVRDNVAVSKWSGTSHQETWLHIPEERRFQVFIPLKNYKCRQTQCSGKYFN